MKMNNAIKSLAAIGTVIRDEYNRPAVTLNGWMVCVGGDSTKATSYEVRRVGAKDDFQTDYHAGTYYKNLTQALNGLRWLAAREA